MNTKERENSTTEKLIEKQYLLTAEIEALQFELNQIENELFYRKNPECRPKQ